MKLLVALISSPLIGGLIAALFIKASLVAMAGFVLVGAALLLVSLTPINRSRKNDVLNILPRSLYA